MREPQLSAIAEGRAANDSTASLLRATLCHRFPQPCGIGLGSGGRWPASHSFSGGWFRLRFLLRRNREREGDGGSRRSARSGGTMTKGECRQPRDVCRCPNHGSKQLDRGPHPLGNLLSVGLHRDGVGPRRTAVSSASIAETWCCESSKSKTSKFSAMRAGFVDFGMAERPCCTSSAASPARATSHGRVRWPAAWVRRMRSCRRHSRR